MTEWSNETAIQPMELYEAGPILWDPKNPNHKDKAKVHDAWMRVSVAMKMPIEDLKNKKNSLMATFRGHLRKKKASIRSGAGEDDIYKPIWFLYNQMENFMGNINDCRPTINTEQIGTAVSEAIEEIVDDPYDLTQSSQTPHHTSRRRANPSELQQAEKHMKEAFTSLNHAIAKQKEDDEYDLFGKIIAKKVRRLPEDKRELMMYKIHGLFLEQDLNSSHSSSPNTLPSLRHINSSFSPPISYPATNFHTRPSSSLSMHSEPFYDIQNRPSSSITSYSEPAPIPAKRQCVTTPKSSPILRIVNPKHVVLTKYTPQCTENSIKDEAYYSAIQEDL